MSPGLDALIAEFRRTGTLSGLPREHFIHGAYQPGSGSAALETFDPGSGQAFAQFAAGSAAEVDQAVDAARRALRGAWGDAAPAERGRTLAAIAQQVREHADRLALVESLDSGKRLCEAQADVRGVVRAFEYYAGAADKMQGDSFPLDKAYVGFSIEEPVGVAAQIIPWNYPLGTAARGIAPALAAGCTVVAKPAEQTPLSALMLAELASAAGLPDGVLNVVTGEGATAGAALVSHPGIQHITFTGSVATGQQVMRAAASHVTRVLLELGGKSPLVVLADADVEQALHGVLGAIYENAGQICSAGSRLIVERSLHGQFIERLLDRVGQLGLGHGLTNPDVGPVNSLAHLNRIHAHVASAAARGNPVLAGGSVAHPACAPGGWFYRPTVIEASCAQDAVVQQEIFGPVLVVQQADDLEQAIALANGTDYALAAGIYTRDIGRAYRFARQVDAGQVYINEYFAGGIEVPFGGNRRSGFGREKGLEGIRSYCKLKSIVARV
ncbi:aldehyde dehydrogenase family protein [Verminephrobacter aporrectodeae subsp. tuberculatae]|uniref:aldehyde dehydrogenase family protein n=1 Tax=Verminephrobacter aporrectodeae TaxID=1110389 RepID=UPI0022370F67|nr:aldehyde dehydrogenase family protein [Verminephrobacter aporrectodeae]MCW5257792.1 aldehyde dehydrogenase family protein [Verminephrobacter aporrectodeae subsp. tuberculatae]